MFQTPFYIHLSFACVGVNYIPDGPAMAWPPANAPLPLGGCYHDAKICLETFNAMSEKADFKDVATKFLSDVENERPPTRNNILKALMWLHFSGHGLQIEDTGGDEEGGFDESLVALDGLVIDDEIRAVLCNSLPEGVTLYVVMDCCHSGFISNLHCEVFHCFKFLVLSQGLCVICDMLTTKFPILFWKIKTTQQRLPTFS